VRFSVSGDGYQSKRWTSALKDTDVNELTAMCNQRAVCETRAFGSAVCGTASAGFASGMGTNDTGSKVEERVGDRVRALEGVRRLRSNAVHWRSTGFYVQCCRGSLFQRGIPTNKSHRTARLRGIEMEIRTGEQYIAG
jgi:hypothetical protein